MTPETPRTDELYKWLDGKPGSIQFGEMFANSRALERELSAATARAAEAELAADDANLSRIAAEEERELLRKRAEKAEARVAELENGITAVKQLIAESSGVAGLHLNGDIASWEELRTGGGYSDWLAPFDSALRTAEGEKE